MSAKRGRSNDAHPKPHHRARARQGGRRSLFADTFGLDFDDKASTSRWFAATLLFDEDTSFESRHYAFYVSDAAFDAVFERIRVGFHTAVPPGASGKLNDWNGGRRVYFKDPNGHVLELMTTPQRSYLCHAPSRGTRRIIVRFAPFQIVAVINAASCSTHADREAPAVTAALALRSTS
jgi:catechol 2,3-dioxygenase-like lactoylglutathione lyase family enzyme